MTYTMCIHNLIYYYSQERALVGVGEGKEIGAI
jgi:hypothetical protein